MTETISSPFVPRFGLRQRLEGSGQATGGRPLPQFDIEYHAAITEEACPEDPTLKEHLRSIVAANVATDLDQFDSALHFDNCAFPPGVQRIANLWQLIESRSIEENPYLLFGTMTHTVQDFYAHSNWVELHAGESPLPTWDLSLGSLPSSIVSGTFFLDSPKMCGPGAPTHAELNKDGPESPEGSKVVADGPNKGKTLFSLAYAAALEATRAQFKRLQEVLG
ncbi:MAG: hypothetical protein ACTHK3_06685 [Solirubrobacterales bacterium]